MKTLVAGIGNVFLGDDAFGVAVAERLARGPLREGVRVIDAGIRARHLAYELVDGRYDTAILIDTVARGGAPGTVYLIELDPGSESDSEPSSIADGHAMTPDAVLAFVRNFGGVRTRVLIVGCEPERLEEGIGLSGPVSAAIDEAVTLVRQLVCV